MKCHKCGQGTKTPYIDVRARFSENGKFVTLQCRECGADIGTWIIFET